LSSVHLAFPVCLFFFLFFLFFFSIASFLVHRLFCIRFIRIIALADRSFEFQSVLVLVVVLTLVYNNSFTLT
jgi:hypothetical protein